MGANEWRSDGRLPEEGRVGLRRAWMFGGGGQLGEGGKLSVDEGVGLRKADRIPEVRKSWTADVVRCRLILQMGQF